MPRRRRARPLAAAGMAFAVVLVLLGGARASSAQDFPDFTAPVVDAAGAVPDDVETQVNAALNDYQRRSGNQVAVAVVRTTGRSSLEDYTIDLAREWGVGEKGEDNGVLLLIAIEDRRLRIEVGRGLEGTLTDLQSGRIRDRVILRLREGDVGGAVVEGTVAIRQVLGDTEAGPVPAPPQEDTGSEGGGSAWPLLFVLPVLGLGLLGGGRRRGRGGFGGFGGGFGAPIFWGGGLGGGGFGGGHRGGGGGGFGGGFGGGGGGGFGGGGASGGW
ncbi:MAG TPA: TPM domain-containing protein [Acidimicrobiales bacterium]|nr:TPM domain-containing protein [Acidimicrobiales bacterium]